ncbi:hypothetical protein [Kitasatospora humi]|nr:hypothetical protein [Kitasatospora humi]
MIDHPRADEREAMDEEFDRDDRDEQLPCALGLPGPFPGAAS